MTKKNKCSFCGQDKKSMIRGQGTNEPVYICFDCLKICTNKITTTKKNISKMKLDANLKPSAIKNMLSEHVIDQNIAKEKVAVSIYNHYKLNEYIKTHDGNPPIEIQKSNVIFAGPTGCGKTLMVKTIAKNLGIPLAMADATTLTEAGYVGKKI